MNNVKIIDQMPDTDKAILAEIKNIDQQRRMGSHDNSLPIVEVKPPPSVVIECPLTSPNLRQAVNCLSCNYFHGIAQKAWSDTHVLAWSAKYTVRCGRIIERTTRDMVIG